MHTGKKVYKDYIKIEKKEKKKEDNHKTCWEEFQIKGLIFLFK
jgi:hypothetical protein